MPAEIPTILQDEDGSAVEVVNADGKASICLVCEHASASIPRSLGTLGLGDADLRSHAAWDIGAGDLAQALSEALDAPLVRGRISRLVIDVNRPTEASDAIPVRAEMIDIPGNSNLADAERQARIDQIYRPFEKTLSATLDRFSYPPALVTVHSFTPTWFGKTRTVELGLLHDTDDRLATRMMRAADPILLTELNAPYSAADGVTHTLAAHAVPRGLHNVMIEVRNDLLNSADRVRHMTDILCKMITSCLSQTRESAA